MKSCFACGRSKPISEFQRRSRNKDGLDHVCRACDAARQRAYRARKGRTRQVGGRESVTCVRCGAVEQRVITPGPGKRFCDGCLRERVNERSRSNHKASHLKRYGITPQQWADALARQSGRCAICLTTEPGGKWRQWAIDHDHQCCPTRNACGRCFRGLLCNGCNAGIGSLGDDPQRLRAAAAYLEQHRNT